MKNYSPKTVQQSVNKQNRNSQTASKPITDNQNPDTQPANEQISQEQTALVEQYLQPLKHKYLAQQMSDEHLQQLIQKMEEAKNMKCINKIIQEYGKLQLRQPF